jgi:uncharacterized protein YecE (DUF72 family)
MKASQLPIASPFDFAAQKAIPGSIHFGASSWNYPGWKGLVYQRKYKSEKEFKANSLEEYAHFPLFSTVGVDSFFYAPPGRELLQKYAEQVPSHFHWVSKVWERLTVFQWPRHARYGRLANTLNPDFLDAAVFKNAVLENYRSPDVMEHTGPFVFQFPTFDRNKLSLDEFLSKLDRFLKELPGDFRYATEVRNPQFLTSDYFNLLNKYGLTHCFNHWHLMPPLKEQMQAAANAGGLKANFFVARLLTPIGVSYERAVNMFKPYDTIRRPNPEMRKDAVQLILRAIKRNDEAFMVVNNRSEGNAPMTIDAIGRLVREQLALAPGSQRKKAEQR